MTDPVAQRTARFLSAALLICISICPCTSTKSVIAAIFYPTEFLPNLEAGGIGVIVAAIYLEDRYLPDRAKEVALDQIACLRDEVEHCSRFAICKSYSEIAKARAAGKIALIIGMEGAEPLGNDLNLLSRVLRARDSCDWTHACAPKCGCDRRCFCGEWLVESDGLTKFGRDLVRECDRLGIIVDLAHINSAGFDEILSITSQPPIISHTNVRKFYEIDRNASDEQIRAIGQRGGIVGVNSILVSPRQDETTIDHFVDHIDH